MGNGAVNVSTMPEGDAKQSGLCCYRCGSGLESLSLPFSRLDLCPECGIELHVCRMCGHYAPSLPEACDEDDATEVRDKTAANFCDWFVPRPGAFDGRELRAEDAARQQLDALFGAAENSGEATGKDPDSPEAAGDSALAEAEKLFR